MTQQTAKTDMKARIGAKILAGELGPRAKGGLARIISYAEERLDYSQPPPGWRIEQVRWEAGPDAVGELVDPPEWTYLHDDEPDGLVTAGVMGTGGLFEERIASTPDGARDAAWRDWKTRHDPPGLRVDSEEADWYVQVLDLPHYDAPGHVGPARFFTSEDDARAAAWAWYWRRMAVAKALEHHPEIRIDHCGSCGAENEPQIDDRCPECGATSCLISTWGREQAERYRTSERYMSPEGERDQEVGPDFWPRCLTWPDDQVAEVERWLVDSTAEIPEVLRG